MLGIYFSGTGNTRHCVNYFTEHYNQGVAISIEDSHAIEAICKADTIVFGYPLYYSNLPKIVCDFICQNRMVFKNKKIFIIGTMGLYSGDGAGCVGRLLKACGANIIGGLHLKMPDCIGDEKILKRPLEKNKKLVREAEIKILKSVNLQKEGKATRDGLGFFSHVAGLFGQRLWFGSKTKNYSSKLKVDNSKCIGCGKCVALCPMDNLIVVYFIGSKIRL